MDLGKELENLGSNPLQLPINLLQIPRRLINIKMPVEGDLVSYYSYFFIFFIFFIGVYPGIGYVEIGRASCRERV